MDVFLEELVTTRLLLLRTATPQPASFLRCDKRLAVTTHHTFPPVSGVEGKHMATWMRPHACIYSVDKNNFIYLITM